MEAVHEVHVSDTFLDHVVEIVGRTRKHRALALGCSPRAGISLIKSSRARALIHGRDYVVPEDLFALAEDTILHRIRLSYESLADGLTGPVVLQEILSELGAPRAVPPPLPGTGNGSAAGSATAAGPMAGPMAGNGAPRNRA
jgi:MoxR-like ATPase